MNRYIDEIKMNESKERTIDYVLSSIEPKQRIKIFTKTRAIFTSVLTIAIAIAVILTLDNTSAPTPTPNPVLDSSYETESISQLSYLTANLITSSFAVTETHALYLSSHYYLVDEETEFESNEETINLYFDTLRIFLEDDLFSDTVEVVESPDVEEQFVITFTVEEDTYILTITFDEDKFEGTMEVNGETFDVTGLLEDTEEEFKLVLKATKGDSFIEIEYKTEAKENETEHKYEIKQEINNVLYEKEVKVSREQNEYKVEIQEGNKQYQLKKEYEDGEHKYKLEYSIDGTVGEATITETTDSEGNKQYQYQIKEGNVEKEINKGKPDTVGGNNNGNGKGNNQSNDEENNSAIFSI